MNVTQLDGSYKTRSAANHRRAELQCVGITATVHKRGDVWVVMIHYA